MTNELPLIDEQQYIKTRRRVHSIARLVGRLREVMIEPIAKNDNLWLNAADKGFSTPPMARYNDLEIGFNMEILCIEIADDKNRYGSVSVTGKTMQELAAEVLDVLKNDFALTPAIEAGEFDGTRKIEIEPEAAGSFLQQLIWFSAAINGFHKKIAFNDGVKTQVCLWPHNFDNAFKWFSGRKIDESDEFMTIGVSNGDDMYELPYMYMTIYPELRKMNTLDIPEGANLHDSGWQGLLLTYEAITEKASAEEQSEIVDNFLVKGFAAIKRGFSKR
jgi:hypothetical protein